MSCHILFKLEFKKKNQKVFINFSIKLGHLFFEFEIPIAELIFRIFKVYTNLYSKRDK